PGKAGGRCSASEKPLWNRNTLAVTLVSENTRKSHAQRHKKLVRAPVPASGAPVFASYESGRQNCVIWVTIERGKRSKFVLGHGREVVSSFKWRRARE